MLSRQRDRATERSPFPTASTGVGPQRPFAAVVQADGAVDEIGSAAGARFLAKHPILVRYALALLASRSREATFFWQDPSGGWKRIRIQAELASPGAKSGATVTIEASHLPHGLTPRELDVLTLMAGGLSNNEIAHRLVTSARTVSTHVEHILAKLGQSGRAGAAAVAAEEGCLRLPIPGRGGGRQGLTVAFLHGYAEHDDAVEPVPRTPTSYSRPLRRMPLLVGSAFPLSGPAGFDGREMLCGSRLAVAEINARGGIAGRPVEQVVVDADIFTGEGIRRAFEQLFAAEVDAITSGYVFVEDIARELAAGYGAPYLHAMTSESHAQVVRDDRARYERIFQVCPTELHYGRGFVRFLDEIRAARRWTPAGRRLAFIETPLASGQMVNELTVRAAERGGWEIATVQTVPSVDVDWAGPLRRLEQADPVAVMVTHFLAGELAAFQRQVARRLPDILVYAIYAPSVPEFLQLAGPEAEGLVWATVTGTYSDPVGTAFADDYVRTFGRPPGRSHAGIAYDEIHLLGQAWASVANPSHFRAVAEQLRRIRYRGVNGGYYLDNGGQSGLGFPDITRDPSLGQAHLVFQVQHGRNRIISPSLYADGSFLPPQAARSIAAGV